MNDNVNVCLYDHQHVIYPNPGPINRYLVTFSSGDALTFVVLAANKGVS